MADLPPGEFSSLTGLSAKALRLYEDRGLLVPAVVDASSGYRLYDRSQLELAGRIALLRQAGISLSDIGRFLESPRAETIQIWLEELQIETAGRRRALEALAAAMGLVPPDKETEMTVVIRPVGSMDELTEAFDRAGALFEPVFDHTDRHRFAELRAAWPDQSPVLLVAEADGLVGTALGFVTGPDATLRVLAVDLDHRRAGMGRSLLRAFEHGAARLGATRVSLGADQEVGFYVRHGYRPMLLAQWVYDPSRYEEEVASLLTGPAQSLESRRSSFNDVPQLFIDLDEPDPQLRARVRDVAAGAHVGYCVTRDLKATETVG